MRFFAATLGTESNSFSPLPTGLATFEDALLIPAGEHPDEPDLFTAPLWAARRHVEAHGGEVVQGLCAFATPAGPTVQRVYEELRDQILDQLREAMPVDAVVLGLHGAMVAEGYDDCEGDLLARHGLAKEGHVLRSHIAGVEPDPSEQKKDEGDKAKKD